MIYICWIVHTFIQLLRWLHPARYSRYATFRHDSAVPAHHLPTDSTRYIFCHCRFVYTFRLLPGLEPLPAAVPLVGAPSSPDAARKGRKKRKKKKKKTHALHTYTSLAHFTFDVRCPFTIRCAFTVVDYAFPVIGWLHTALRLHLPRVWRFRKRRGHVIYSHALLVRSPPTVVRTFYAFTWTAHFTLRHYTFTYRVCGVTYTGCVTITHHVLHIMFAAPFSAQRTRVRSHLALVATGAAARTAAAGLRRHACMRYWILSLPLHARYACKLPPRVPRPGYRVQNTSASFAYFPVYRSRTHLFSMQV